LQALHSRIQQILDRHQVKQRSQSERFQQWLEAKKRQQRAEREKLSNLFVSVLGGGALGGGVGKER